MQRTSRRNHYRLSIWKEEEEEKPHPSHLCFRSCGPPWSSSVRKVHCYQLFRSFPEGLLDSPFARGINWLHSWLIRATKAKRTSLPSSFFSAEEGFDPTLRPSCVGRCQRMGNSLSPPPPPPHPIHTLPLIQRGLYIYIYNKDQIAKWCIKMIITVLVMQYMLI